MVHIPHPVGFSVLSMRTNAAAMASTSALHRSQKSLAKSLNRLAEGRRVVGAADDAAGLGVSVNLDTQ